MIGAGVVAGTVATLIQLPLWLIFTDDFPAILFRDARLTTALALGESVLQPSVSFDTGIMLVATLLHFTLSMAYAARFAQCVAWFDFGSSALLAGAGFGVVLYIVNLTPSILYIRCRRGRGSPFHPLGITKYGAK